MPLRLKMPDWPIVCSIVHSERVAHRCLLTYFVPTIPSLEPGHGLNSHATLIPANAPWAAVVVMFWAAVALVAFTYAGFPLVLLLRALWKRRPIQKADITPSVTMLIVAHNEAGVIRERLDNALALDYPSHLLDILVASDGSDDGTDEIVAEYAARGVWLLSLPRGGKIAALNAAVPHAQGDILVFSDANSMCAPSSLRALVRPFADTRVGGVAGRQVYTSAGTFSSTANGECAYFSIDQKLKEWETAAGSITTATGALYGMRRSLFESIPDGVADDFLNSLRVVQRGYRMVYEPRAIVAEQVAASSAVEFRRKIRIIALGLRTLSFARELLDPGRYHFYSFQLLSHKVLRWMMPWPLLVLLCSSAILAPSAPLYRAVFLAQASFYAAALLASLVPNELLRRIGPVFVLTVPYYFCVAYAGSLGAQWLTLRGRRWDTWKVTPRHPRNTVRQMTPASPQPADKFAYIMSRFPKITETFILYEICNHIQRGEDVSVYPLIREREQVAHAETKLISNRLRFLPLMSYEIVRANLNCLRRDPKGYLLTAAEALRGTCGNANFFLGAIAFFPKSVAFADVMKRTGVTHVHAHFATHPALSALIVYRLAGIPYSFTAHGHDVHCDRRMLREKVEAARFVIAISEYNRNLIAEECGEQFRDKIHVIHCGVDTEYFTPAQADPPSTPFRIVCVASFWEVKGHKYLIEATRRLREHGIEFFCDLIGSGELRNEVERLIRAAELGDAFRIHGPQPRDVVRDILQHAHVKVLASVPTSNGLREGIPVALMEAMACCLPVVSSAISGIPELVEHGVSGILVQPRDTLALAEALERVALDPDLRVQMGTAGRQRVLREFDISKNAETLTAHLKHESEGSNLSMPSVA